MEKAREKLKDMAEGGNLSDSSVEENTEPRWKKYARNRGQSKAKEEFSTLVSTLIVLATAAWNAPESVKPSKDEIAGVSEHLTGIILRHVDISSAITADVIDVIGILAISAVYISRVGPELRALRGGGSEGGGGRPPKPLGSPPGGNGARPSVEEPVIKVPLSSDAKNFLDRISGGGTNEAQ